MRGEIGAAGAQGAALPRDDQLRADAVGGGRDEAAVTERVECRELPESASAPVDSTAARSRSTTASAVASETPASSYVALRPRSRSRV